MPFPSEGKADQGLLRTSAWSALSVAVRAISGLLMGKLIALYVGPAGFAVIGQFSSALSIISSAGGGLILTGITKATAQHSSDSAKQREVWATAFRISAWACLFTAMTLLVASAPLSKVVLHQSDMSIVFILVAACLPAISANNLLLAIINGMKEFRLYVTANIVAALIALATLAMLVPPFGLHGALIASALSPALALTVTAWLISGKDWFSVRFILGGSSRPAARTLAAFALMAATTAVTVPLSHILIREYLIETLGLSAAGYWQGMWKISETYLTVLTATLSLYYLPRLAEIHTAGALVAEVKRVYRLLLPFAAILAIAVFSTRNLIVKVLFSPAFVPMGELFGWQMVGDVIKVGSWILGYVMLGRAMVKPFVVTEVLFSLSLLAFTVFFVSINGLIGASIAYAVNYSLYWICMVVIVRRELRRMPA